MQQSSRLRRVEVIWIKGARDEDNVLVLGKLKENGEGGAWLGGRSSGPELVQPGGLDGDIFPHSRFQKDDFVSRQTRHGQDELPGKTSDEKLNVNCLSLNCTEGCEAMRLRMERASWAGRDSVRTLGRCA